MFDWNGCPVGLFDMYMEVGEVKEAKIKAEECIFVEVWVTSTFARQCVRTESKHPARRAIYDVLKQIRALCGNKPACIILMCDDKRDDTILWGGAILLLLNALAKENRLKYAILFARGSEEDTDSLVQTTTWNTEKEELLLLLDAVVYGQANYYVKQENPHIRSHHDKLPSLLKEYLQFIQNDQ